MYLHVYKLGESSLEAKMADLVKACHAGVQVYDYEYSFGPCAVKDKTRAGICVSVPAHCPYFTYKMSLLVGYTTLSHAGVREC